MRWELRLGSCYQLVKELEDESIDCVVTSPPYFRQRVYSEFFDEEEVGNERSLVDYVDNLRVLFWHLRAKLKSTGTVFLNLGDKYENKKLLGVPWRVALALQEDGWILRNDIIWHKPNPMPSSAQDRFTPSHEHVFFFVKSKNYHFDQILEPAAYAGVSRGGSKNRYEQNNAGMDAKTYDFRNKRDVWSIRPATANGAHTAVFPGELVEHCITAGCPIGGTVLDPFAGVATAGVEAKRLSRSFIGFELNAEFVERGRDRLAGQGLPKLDPTKSHAARERARSLLGESADEEDVTELIEHAVEALKEEQETVETYNAQVDEIRGYGVTLAAIRRAEDPDGVTGFDELVDAVNRDRERFSMLATDEQGLFEQLKLGKLYVPALRNDSIWTTAMDRYGA